MIGVGSIAGKGAVCVTVLFACGIYMQIIAGIFSGRVRTAGLLKARASNGKFRVSPQRVQVLVATLTVAGHYIGTFLESDRTSLPEVPSQLLAILGASHLAYNGSKGYLVLRKKARKVQQ